MDIHLFDILFSEKNRLCKTLEILDGKDADGNEVDFDDEDDADDKDSQDNSEGDDDDDDGEDDEDDEEESES